MLELNRVWIVVLAVACGLLELGVPRTAHAGLAACGDIHVEASAQCEVVLPGASCEAMCEPVSIRAACAAQLAVDCRGECPELPSVSCQGECSASCKADCSKLEPGKFDCAGECSADCSARCSASCKAESDQAGCEASCEGSCGASCDGHCEGTAPKVDCEAGCKASCDGSCEADANFDCQVECQAMGQAKCEVSVEGGCKADCKTEEGALFCDGQYVDSGDNLKACADALAELDIQVDGRAESRGDCVGASCRGEARATASVNSDCAVSEPGSGGNAFSVLFGGFAFVAWRRLRRQTDRG